MGRALTSGEERQLAQWLNSYVAVRGHEPFPHEIEEFERRVKREFAPDLTPGSMRGRKSSSPTLTAPPGYR
jgi:hypothetical protein